jgi:hypothetical protein
LRRSLWLRLVFLLLLLLLGGGRRSGCGRLRLHGGRYRLLSLRAAGGLLRVAPLLGLLRLFLRGRRLGLALSGRRHLLARLRLWRLLLPRLLFLVAGGGSLRRRLLLRACDRTGQERKGRTGDQKIPNCHEPILRLRESA